jgi:hypothetical protein
MGSYSRGKLKLFREIVFGRLGLQNDFVGYEILIDYIYKNKIHELEGDFLEIGAFMGGGSVKLARYAGKYSKKLIIVDLFDPDFDSTPNDRGEPMSWIYRKILGQKNLRKVFNKNTKNEKNIVVYAGDSKEMKLSDDTKLSFTFIDGNHDPEYTKSDFYLAWSKTTSGGVVAFHDYGGDLPQVKDAIDEVINKERESIIKKKLILKKCIILLHKK